MRERRKQERKSLIAYTQVFDLYGGYLLGYLGDLTLLGAMVICEKPLSLTIREGRMLAAGKGNGDHARLRTPGTAEHPRNTYDIAGACGMVRTGPESAVLQCRAGIQGSRAAPKNVDRIDHSGIRVPPRHPKPE
ncbi:MAG TPA: hypothetical protein PLF42_04100 [Anaerolineales bacterium]|nr:hypothetical protein [Anaerolineales bacterium]